MTAETRRDGNALALATGDVGITTAAVTIRVMKVGARQMTQAIFRQLPADRLVDEEAVALRGVPWGWVNYTWGDQAGRNYVVQFGAELRRCNVRLIRSSAFRFDFSYSNRPPSGYTEMAETLDGLVRGLAVLELLDEATPPAKSYSRHFDFGTHRERVHGDIAHDAGQFSSPWHGLVTPASYFVTGQAIAASRAHARGWLARNHGGDVTRPEMERRIEALRLRVVDYCRRWDELMAQVEAIGQLFVAV